MVGIDETFRVKVCGVTDARQAEMVAAAGVDAIGLNFYPPSPRFLTDERAGEVAAAIPPGVARVGVFVNAPRDLMERAIGRGRLDWIQLHGDEPPETIAGLAPLRVLRAFRCRGGDLTPVTAYLRQCADIGALPTAVLLDAYSDQAYGGTGEKVDWPKIARVLHSPTSRRSLLFDLPIVLAGGLTAENVGDAIRLSGADAVDTASGVESAPGIKCLEKVQAFVREATSALRNS